MSEFTLQDQIDALKYVAENNGCRFVSLEIHQGQVDPVYTFVYQIINSSEYKIVKNTVYAEIDAAIEREVQRFQNVG